MNLNLRAQFSSTHLSQDEIIPEVIRILLKNRGITDVDEFLSESQIDENFVKKIVRLFGDNLSAAVEEIRSAIDQQKSIVIHGDYDVDGISSTAILWETIYYHLGYPRVVPFIPHRVNHGYGLSLDSIDDIVRDLQAKGERPGLLITVDCGVTAAKSVEYAHQQGFAVIVTDHHTKPENEDDLPRGIPILHTYELCGAGIAWVLACALKDNPDNYQDGIDLVALATLSDIQPLIGFNRVLVKAGLTELTNTVRPGLQAMYELAGITGKRIGGYEVGFIIGPRLNATGRLEHGLDALRLLVTRNPVQGFEIAQRLDGLNQKRQRLTLEATNQAVRMVEESHMIDKLIIVSHPDWHEGIIGLIAAKLVEKFNQPAIVISENEHHAKGSARSISGINIVEALYEHQSFLTSVGGHAMAAGLSLDKQFLEEFKQSILSVNLSEKWPNRAVAGLEVDLDLPFEGVSWGLYQALGQFEPFGLGNPRPLFYSQSVVVKDAKTVGKTNDHLKIKLDRGIEGIGFGLGPRAIEVTAGSKIGLVYSLDMNDYWGSPTVQVKIKDFEVTE